MEPVKEFHVCENAYKPEQIFNLNENLNMSKILLV